MVSINTVFGVAILRNEFSQFARSVRGGREGYGAGFSFSHGFQLAFTFKTVFKALDSDLHFVIYQNLTMHSVAA